MWHLHYAYLVWVSAEKRKGGTATVGCNNNLSVLLSLPMTTVNFTVMKDSAEGRKKTFS